MAFESLSDKLQNVFKNLRAKGRLTEEDVKLALKEVKMALLEADVGLSESFSKVLPSTETSDALQPIAKIIFRSDSFSLVTV